MKPPCLSLLISPDLVIVSPDNLLSSYSSLYHDPFHSPMKQFIKNSEALRRAVAHILLDPELDGVLCSFDNLISPLNCLGGSGSDDVAIVDTGLIQRSFKEYTPEKDYFKTYSELGIDIPDAGNHILLIRNARRIGKGNKYYQFCHVREGDKSNTPSADTVKWPHPLNHGTVKRRLDKSVPQGIKDALKLFLIQVKQEEKSKAAYNAKISQARAQKAAKKSAIQISKRLIYENKMKAAKKSNKQQHQSRKNVVEEETTVSNQRKRSSQAGIIPTITPNKRLDERKQTWTPEEQELASQATLLRMKIIDDSVTLQKMIDRMEVLRSERLAKQKQKENTPNNSTAKPTKNKKPKIIHYNFNGRAGRVKVENGGIIFVEDMMKKLEPLEPDMVGNKADGIRQHRRYKLARYGKSHAWVYEGTEMIANTWMSKLLASAEIVKNMNDLFSAEQCVISRESLCRAAAYNLHNYGGSDEATQMIMAGTLDMLFNEIGFECSAEQLAKAVPSQRTIARYELNLAVDCLLKVLQEIKDDGAKFVGIMCDHGHRGGQDHFVIIIVWSGWRDRKNKKGRTVKFFCPSIDHAGHKAVEAAKAVKVVVDRLLFR